MDYFEKDLFDLLSLMIGGINWISEIVKLLWIFFYLDEVERKYVDIYIGINSILFIF